MRVVVGAEHLDLRGLVEQSADAPVDGAWPLAVTVTWTDGRRLQAERMTQPGGSDPLPPGESSFGAQRPAVRIDVTDSVPPFWLTPPNSADLPAGPGDRGDGAEDPAETPLPGATEDRVAPLDSVPPDVVLPRVDSSGAYRVAFRDRAERSQGLLDEAREAEAAGDLAEARRRAVLALAYHPTDGELRDYVDRLEHRLVQK